MIDVLSGVTRVSVDVGESGGSEEQECGNADETGADEHWSSTFRSNHSERMCSHVFAMVRPEASASLASCSFNRIGTEKYSADHPSRLMLVP